jgi:PBP1b-binding outer membrane lipoprotein LpoB
MTRWTRLATLVGAAALLVGCGGDNDAGAGASRSEAAVQTTSVEAAPMALTVPATPTGRCMPPNVENLRVQDTAFEGTVAEVTGASATLDVSQMYTGDEMESVTVSAPSQDMSSLVLAVDFQQGQTYLVSSLDGQVSVCGLSGPRDDFLLGLYQEAYAG